ncbi:hypothetical protein D3C72_1211260 [compost metagenome]
MRDASVNWRMGRSSWRDTQVLSSTATVRARVPTKAILNMGFCQRALKAPSDSPATMTQPGVPLISWKAKMTLPLSARSASKAPLEAPTSLSFCQSGTGVPIYRSGCTDRASMRPLPSVTAISAPSSDVSCAALTRVCGVVVSIITLPLSFCMRTAMAMRGLSS